MDKTVLGLPLKKKKESCKKPVRVIHFFDVENLIIVFFFRIEHPYQVLEGLLCLVLPK
jgi:hypothetical protein